MLKPLILVSLVVTTLSAAEPDRTAWWRDAKFGMFIHWGIYAVPADSTDLNGKKHAAEWYFNNKQAQVKDYEKFAAQFNPTEFDAKEWVRIAKGAGMKYIVITSKHHDGFAMFDTKLSDYSIVKATPFKRDPMKELADACREAGISLSFYHSIMDWHHPDYLPRRKWEGTTRPGDGASLDRYIDYMKGQLTELLTNYGQIGGIWFDGSWEHNEKELRSAEVNAMIRKLQPHALINDRNRLKEDYDTPEQHIPKEKLAGGRLWETCMTMNDTWGYAKNDENWKSSTDLIRKLIDIASKGGNFLLNVGPDEKGSIPKPSVERLAAVGEWMKTNGQSIYGTTADTLGDLSFDGRCTVKGNKLYVHVFDWKGESVELPKLTTKMKWAQWLNGSKTQVEDRGGVLTIRKPDKVDPAATVIEIDLAAPPATQP